MYTIEVFHYDGFVTEWDVKTKEECAMSVYQLKQCDTVERVICYDSDGELVPYSELKKFLK